MVRASSELVVRSAPRALSFCLVETCEDFSMRSLLLAATFAASFVFVGSAQAVPRLGLPDPVCSGPAGASNPHCQSAAVVPGTPVPEPGAAGVFAIGVALIARSQRRTR